MLATLEAPTRPAEEMFDFAQASGLHRLGCCPRCVDVSGEEIERLRGWPKRVGGLTFYAEGGYYPRSLMLGPTNRRLLQLMADHYPKAATERELAGSPHVSHAYVRSVICRLRPLLAPFGVRVVRQRFRGYRLEADPRFLEMEMTVRPG